MWISEFKASLVYRGLRIETLSRKTTKGPKGLYAGGRGTSFLGEQRKLSGDYVYLGTKGGSHNRICISLRIYWGWELYWVKGEFLCLTYKGKDSLCPWRHDVLATGNRSEAEHMRSRNNLRFLVSCEEEKLDFCFY